jgi:hypothetical protein
MQEFIQHLIEKTGISDDQAHMVANAIREFVSKKAPMMSGAVDQILGAALNNDSKPAGDAPAANVADDLLGGLKSKMGGFF